MTEERFTDQAVRGILARAIDLDHSRADTVSLSQLRSIAGELGISTDTVTVALQEYRASQTVLGTPRTMLRTFANWASVGTASCLVLAGLYAGTNLPVFTLGLGTWLGTSAVLAFRGRTPAPQRAFQARNAGLWLGVTGAQLIAVLFDGGAVAGRILVPMGVAWVATSIVGAAVLRVRQWRRDRTRRDDGSFASSLKHRLRVSLTKWINHILQRSEPVDFATRSAS